MRLRDKCQEHDAATKIRTAQQFLQKGHVVKVIALTGGVLAAGPNANLSGPRAAAEKLVVRFIEATKGLATSNGIGGSGPSISTTLTPKPADE